MSIAFFLIAIALGLAAIVPIWALWVQDKRDRERYEAFRRRNRHG